MLIISKLYCTFKNKKHILKKMGLNRINTNSTNYSINNIPSLSCQLETRSSLMVQARDTNQQASNDNFTNALKG